MITRIQAEKTYEGYLIKLGSSARELGANTVTRRTNKIESKTRPLGRTERADTDVQFKIPLRNMTLAPGSSVLINCDTVRASRVQLTFTPRSEDLEYVATIYNSPTNASLLIVQVRVAGEVSNGGF